MDDYKIEKNVPLPTLGKSANRKYPFDEMEISDSVFIPGQKITTVSGSLAWWRPKKFTCRTVDGGVRVWRIK